LLELLQPEQEALAQVVVVVLAVTEARMPILGMDEVHVQDFADAVASPAPALEDLARAAVLFGVRVVAEKTAILGALCQQAGVAFIGCHDHRRARQLGQTFSLRRTPIDGPHQAAQVILLEVARLLDIDGALEDLTDPLLRQGVIHPGADQVQQGPKHGAASVVQKSRLRGRRKMAEREAWLRPFYRGRRNCFWSATLQQDRGLGSADFGAALVNCGLILA
jgi:hypothetical protein